MPAARVPRAARARRARRGPTASTPSCPARVIPATGHDRDIRFSPTNKRRDSRISPMSVCLASGVLGANRERDGRDFAGSGLETQKKNAPRASATPEKSEARSVRAFSLLATSRRRPIEERSRTLGVTHKRHSENGLRRPRKARFFVSDASPRALHDARTRRATLPPSGRPTPVTPVLARSRRTSARTRTRTPRVRPLRE